VANGLQTLTPKDRQRCMDILATIRVKRRSRKSVKRRFEDGKGEEHDGNAEDAEADEEYEQKGLPSVNARATTTKPLVERLKELQVLHSNEERARSLRYGQFFILFSQLLVHVFHI
jgi:hypothetical protein